MDIKSLTNWVKQHEKNNTIDRFCNITLNLWLDDEIIFNLTDNWDDEIFMRYIRSLNL